MKHQRTIIAVVLLMTFGLTELLAQNAVLSSGGDASGTGGSVSYSVGQVAYTNYEGESGTISLGIQQPYLVIIIGTDEPDIRLSTSIYPNPVNTFVNLRLGEPNPVDEPKNFSLGLYDITGKLLLHQEIVTTVTTIPMANLPNAMYILRVRQNEAEIKTFKIFKTN